MTSRKPISSFLGLALACWLTAASVLEGASVEEMRAATAKIRVEGGPNLAR